MANTESVVITASFQPTNGNELQVQTLLHDHLSNIAYLQGASWVGTYLQKNTTTYVTTTQFPNIESLNLFLSSNEHEKIVKQITSLCKSVVMEEILEVIKEEAA